MIVVMRKNCTQAEINDVRSRIEEHNLGAHISQGVERTVIGVVGQIFPELKDEMEQLPGVLEVLRISKPYKLSSREFEPKDTVIELDGVAIGGKELVVMAGPCSVETEEQVMVTAKAVNAAGAKVLRGGAFKPRTSPYAFRGLGLQGLRMLADARKETGLKVITEVMAPEDVELVAQYADILQVGTRNMQNYRLLDEVGKPGKPVMLKRGFSSTYEEWLLASEYIMSSGNRNVILCERGIRTFEPYTRNTVDITAVPVIRNLSHLPVFVDPSHGTGRSDLVTPLSLAAVAAGASGLIVEVHPNPAKALSDGAQSLNLEQFKHLMEQVRAIAAVVRPQ
jgi:3-deoxy-7-phosphoheptulonate synthase